MSPEVGFGLLSLAVLGLLLGGPLWRRWQRQRWGARPFPTAWRKLLQRQFPLYNHLPHPLQKRLQAMVQVFVAEKPIIGCQGLQVTDDMRVLVAAQACVLVLELHRQPGADQPHTALSVAPYPELREVLLYPGAFRVDAQQHHPGGVVSQSPEVRLGESWQEGRVVLSWADARQGARSGAWTGLGRSGQASPSPNPATHSSTHLSHNVVMHEFAHQLDQATGPANGAPPLRRGQSAQTWAQVFQRAYEDLRWLADAGEPTLIDPYGATAPEEFFAVVTETFFMQPRALAAQHPELYRQLHQYYQLDPQAW